MWFVNNVFSFKRLSKSFNSSSNDDVWQHADDIRLDIPHEDDAANSRFALPWGIKRIPCSTCKDHFSRNFTCKVVQDPPKASIINGLARMMMLLQYLGLLHHRKRRHKWSASMTYCGFVCFLCCANSLRFFVAYNEVEEYGSKLFLKIILHVWYSQQAFITLIFFFHISKRVHILIRKWNQYCFLNQCQTAEYVRSIANKFTILSGLLMFVVSGVSFGAFVSQEDSYPDSAIDVNKIIPTFKGTALLTRTLYSIFNVFLCTLWVLPTGLVYTICLGLTFNFRNVHQLLTKKAKEEAIVSDKELEIFRFQHQKLCRLTRQTDAVFSLYNLAVFGTSIPLLCFFLYTFAFHAFDGREVAFTLSVLHMLLIVGQLSMVTAAASALNQQAIAPKEELFEMEMNVNDHVAVSRATQVTLFMHRLTNDHIGLTAWNLLNINKKTILTVTTMVLSYVFVLIKFGLTLDYPGHTEVPHSQNNHTT